MAITKFSDITVADVKSYFNFTDNNRDAQILNILPIVTDFIKTYCSHDFESKSRSEYPYIKDAFQTEFFLKYRPVTSVTSIVEDSQTLTRNTDYWIDFDSGKVSKISGSQYSPIFSEASFWNSDPEAILITYVGGEALSFDVVMAFYEIAGIYTQINQKVYVNIEGNETSTKYDSIPKEIMSILDRHKHYHQI